MSGRTPTLTVAVTGMNARPDNPGPGLAVARCLRAEFGDGIRIVGLSYDVLDPGLYLTEVCDAAWLLPYPSAGEERLMDRLREIQAHEKLDVIIPCLDAELPSFSRLQHELAELGVAMRVPANARLRERNKDRLAELAREADIRYPETRAVSNPGFFWRCHEEGWSYPMMVKGLFYDAVLARDAEEAAQAFRKIAAEWGYPVLAQRLVRGHEVNLAGLGDGEGGLLGPVMMRKQAVTDKGKAWSCVTVHDPELEAAARRLVAALKWEGPLEVEMLKGEDGGLWLIEINPRFPAWIGLAAGAGCNLPAGLVRMAQGRTPEFPEAEIGRMMIRYAAEVVIGLDEYEAMAMHGHRTRNDTENMR